MSETSPRVESADQPARLPPRPKLPPRRERVRSGLRRIPPAFPILSPAVVVAPSTSEAPPVNERVESEDPLDVPEMVEGPSAPVEGSGSAESDIANEQNVPPPIAPSAPLPIRRSDLTIAPHGAAGEYVIKDPLTGNYFHLGPEESLLLLSLDGKKDATQVLIDYEKQFGQSIERQDLDDFIELARSMNLLARDPLEERMNPALPGSGSSASASSAPSAPAQGFVQKSEQSILYWRIRLFDPDRLFNWMEPKIRFFWTRSFFLLSATVMLAAFCVSWANREELISRFADVLSWKTFFVAWAAVIIATTCHEFAHGLTCKRYGGEVRDIGFLLLFFMPAFYANVSDAWLFKEKSKRLWVTLAGGWCDLCLWAIAVFVWRLTMQDSLVNYLAWIIMTICGVRSFFNFLPLIKLDGYYILSDLTSTPNLRQRGWDTFMGYVRWALWGAARPTRRQEPKLLYVLAFGAAVWAYSTMFLTVLAIWFIGFLGEKWGPAGTLAATTLAASVLYKQFDGISHGEVTAMWRDRKVRVLALLLFLAALVAVMVLVPLEDRSGGTFQVRSTTRLEVRAPVAGFLREVHGDEGDRLSAGAPVAQMHVPDLDSRIAQKRAEVAEQEANLRLLRFGSRSVPRGPRGLAQSETASEIELRRAEVEAAEAALQRLREELAYLERRAEKLLVRSAVAGVITTQRLREKVGQFFQDGELICVIEEPTRLEAQIDVPEQEAARIRPGQSVQLKARTLPFDQLTATVDRIAPGAEPPDPKEGKLQSTVAVYCLLSDPPPALRPGMTGFARVACGQRPMIRVLSDKALRYFRTEFWW